MSHQNNGSEREAGHHNIIEKKRLHRYWPRHKDARGENTKSDYGTDTTGEKEKRMPKENVDEKITSSHDKKFRTKSFGETERNGVWFPEDSDSYSY